MLFKPTFWLKNVLMIDENFLYENNVSAMILDMDNTLSMHGNPAAEDGITDWLEKMRSLGIKMRVVSNNNTRRVAPLAGILGLQFTANGAKPLTFGVNRAVKAMGAKKSETLVIGDQIFTDVMAGNLAGMRTVLVEPFHLENKWTFRLKRKIESLVFQRNYDDLELK
ncbi:MAG: YqeG family HAD IIIA-type phosphatase [Lachnospiraceae bacterium]|nr:YqeG family HAD IIIA-type phosphatase [Ruminococcus sp.]MCM1274620.1 YqeG family HAD IIIA-type phosphatase [Lachnospiraceae bacterium]